MSAKSIEAQLERMARELIAIAKVLNCSVDLHVTKFNDGTYGGTLFKIGESAIDFGFRDGKKIDFAGLVADKRHLVPLERQDEV
jgi:hypothetical protein